MPSDWRVAPTSQQPVYQDPEALAKAVASLRRLPPLVTSWEIDRLKRQVAEAARGEKFLLQGGDCAERFDECASEPIAARLKILLQMSLVLAHGGRRRVIRVGRFAGQYAKPRSASTETRDGVELPTYRGDNVNAPAFNAADRAADPGRLIEGHARSALTLNFIRALIDGGFADLHHPEYWDLEFVSHSPLAAEYQKMVESIGEGLRFMESLAGVRVQARQALAVLEILDAQPVRVAARGRRRCGAVRGWVRRRRRRLRLHGVGITSLPQFHVLEGMRARSVRVRARRLPLQRLFMRSDFDFCQPWPHLP